MGCGRFWFMRLRPFRSDHAGVWERRDHSEVWAVSWGDPADRQAVSSAAEGLGDNSDRVGSSSVR